jgi:competence ComEA-like helix-hairpin-helix protein
MELSMNVTSTVRRSEQPVQIGSRHGYRIDGDLAYINAELSVPPYHPGGAWALELWACERAYQGGEPSGVKVSEVHFDLPTPIGPHIHRVEAQAPAHLPLQGVAHVMLLALVERDAERCVHDVASYPELETFPAPHFAGEVGYSIRGHEVVLQAAAVANPRPTENRSGTLSIELWASDVDSEEQPETGRGHCLGAAQLAPIAGGESALGLSCRAAFSEPSPGQYRLALLLREWTHALGYLTRDRRAFALPYQVAAEAPAPESAVVAEEAAAPKVVVLEAPVAKPILPEAPAPKAVVLEAPVAKPAVAPVVAPPVAAAPVIAAPVAAAPVIAPRASHRVSIQTASVEELARVKGLNTQVAKEIVKARPFTSLEDLVKVRGIGRKSLDKLRSLLSL